MAYARSSLARRPARPRLRGQASPPPSARDVLLSAIARIGSGLAFAGGLGGGLDAGACEVMAAELRTVYRSLSSLKLAG